MDNEAQTEQANDTLTVPPTQPDGNVHTRPTVPLARGGEPPLMRPAMTLDPRNIAALKGYDETTRPYVAPAETAMSELFEAIKSIITAREAAKQNPTLNEAGQLIAVGDYAGKVQDRAAQKVDATVANLRKAIDATEEMLRTPFEATAAAGPMAAEIRTFVSKLRTEERQSFLTDAVANGDIRSLSAVLSAPGYLSGTSPEQQAFFTRRYHEQKSPDVARRLDVMKAALGKLEAAGSLFISEVPRAMGADWGKVQRLKQAKTQAEQAFVLRGPQ